MDTTNSDIRLQNKLRRRRFARRRRPRNPQQAASSTPETTASIETSNTSSSSISTTSPPECNIVNTLNQTAPDSTQVAPQSGGDTSLEVRSGSHLIDDNNATQPLHSTHQSRTIIGLPENPSSNAVRVLFRDHQLQRQQVNQTNQSSSSTSTRLTQPASIVSANRRLIERQIEAIQVADSRRWNFDFRNCRPLALNGHRYIQCSDESSSRNCRPLNDQNQTALTRFNNQQQCQSTSNQSDCQKRSDHKQDTDG